MSLGNGDASDLLFRLHVQLQYLKFGFSKKRFISYKSLKVVLHQLNPEQNDQKKIDDILSEHHKVAHGHPKSLGDPTVLSADLPQRQMLIQQLEREMDRLKSASGASSPASSLQPARPHQSSKKSSSGSSKLKNKPQSDSTSTRRIQASPQLQLPRPVSPPASKPVVPAQTFDLAKLSNYILQVENSRVNGHGPDNDNDNETSGELDDLLMNTLLLGDTDEKDVQQNIGGDILQNAPLVSRQIVSPEVQHLFPQLGLIGSYESCPLFLNTNVPFSAFVCGVQGSGKSHTTSCILENSLINSRHLGRLKSPLSALVFSYGHFSGDGAGFSISEAAFLAAPGSTVQGHPCVKRLTVLVAPSNYVRISRLYSQLPNVTVRPFALDPRNLGIDTMLTLMAVNESDDLPLYMAQVTNILRKMATTGLPFDYTEFKTQLSLCNFNPAQTSMLELRLSLLESFLDFKGKGLADLGFELDGITIMDMSCPFVDASTACVLFKIGLQMFLQSRARGKLIVLDEAHKYMQNNPGAKALNESLLQTIRLQRHFGARVIISTQEPTLLTDLIALSSIVVIHRFSSPAWFNALKRHIPMGGYRDADLIQEIEGLETGTALVYSANAVVGRDDQGNPVKGTSKMLKVQIRKRVTMDGGQSILASGPG